MQLILDSFIRITTAMKILHNSYVLHCSIILLLSFIKSNCQTVYSCDPNAPCGCSTNSAVLSRIVGGESATSGTWGWMVSISIGGTYLCAGSIISASWVVTAAHCVKNFTAPEITIFAGSTVRFSGPQIRVGSQLIIYSGYDSATNTNDIALLKLASPLIMSDPYVSVICIPAVKTSVLISSEWPASGTTVVAIGWGELSENGVLPTNLQQVTLQTVSSRSSTCAPLLGDWRAKLCAGVSGGGKGVCFGDSGGPLMMFSSSKQWTLVGITSYGADCAGVNYAPVFTRIGAFARWIRAYTNGDISTVDVSSFRAALTSNNLSSSTTRSDLAIRPNLIVVTTPQETTNLTVSEQTIALHANTITTSIFYILISVFANFLAVLYF